MDRDPRDRLYKYPSVTRIILTQSCIAKNNPNGHVGPCFFLERETKSYIFFIIGRHPCSDL